MHSYVSGAASLYASEHLQLRQIRAKSADDPITRLRAQADATNDHQANPTLEKVQAHNLFVAHAQQNHEDKYCKSLLEYMAIEKE